MKLLSKQEVNKDLKKERELILAKNQELLGYMTKGIKRLNNLKDDYGPEKEKKVKEFEAFCHMISLKKSELLKELKAYESLIEERKEVFYGLIEKQDELEEKNKEMELKGKKLNDRERFLVQNEIKLEAGWNSLLKKNA